MNRFTAIAVLALTIPLSSCGSRERGAGTFGSRIEALSEPGGFFDTDNLISNESSYLHVMGALEREGRSGGAYIGVGPDQNFSYIAQLRPDVAYLVDIRRDNMLEHLLFKALFHLSGDRVEYLSSLVGRAPVDGSVPSSNMSPEQLLDFVETGTQTRDVVQRIRTRVDSVIAAFDVELTAEDWATIDRFHRVFITSGMALRFNSFGRAPQSYYPTYRQLLLETDLEGRQLSFLADEDRYGYVRSLQLRDLIIPVVGDLAGQGALRAIGEDIERRGEVLAAFYTSNVEFYLMRDRTFDSFVANVGELPTDGSSLIIRSLFNSTSPVLHPQQVAGYPSIQLLQRVSDLIESFGTGEISSYRQLVTVGALDPSPN